MGFPTACGLVEKFCARWTWDGAGSASEKFQAPTAFFTGWTIVKSGGVGWRIIGLNREDGMIYALDIWCKCLSI